jgi:hypothetical protein
MVKERFITLLKPGEPLHAHGIDQAWCRGGSWRVKQRETRRTDDSGILFAIMTIGGPIFLAIALIYGTIQWRRRRRRYGDDMQTGDR